ncbi:MAG TPA: SDR family oxidoreductase [Rhodanobacteraceae bacterium]|nr:SDR family oxidoreductase [Rhodanobacteraceae bacterium]
MEYELNSKVILVVGGTSGIGLATARAFASAGATVVVASRNSGKGVAAIEELASLGANAAFFECDVSNASSVTRLLDSILLQFGTLDCAVNCAAYDFKPAKAHEVPDREVAKHLAVDVRGLFSCMRAEIVAMLRSKGGTIVNIASTTGLSGTPTAALYSAGKHAVIGLTRSTAKEYIGDGIRINAVCPGVTITPRRERRAAHLSKAEQSEQDQALAREIPIGRPAAANEIANAVIWLSSPLSSYVVGHSLVIDGGLTA